MRVLFCLMLMLNAVQFSATDGSQSSVEKTRAHVRDLESRPCSKNAVNNLNRTLPEGRDCRGIKEKKTAAIDSVYKIDPGDGQAPFSVFCDLTTDGGGWVVFQRRNDGSENFYRTWREYQTGFGNLSGEFYLGNEKIHRLTSLGRTMLRVDLEDLAKHKAYATYDNFVLGDAASNYKLSIGAYAGDALSRHNGIGFSARDKDVDMWSQGNCAQRYHGAWWYGACHESNLNGDYGNNNYGEGLNWREWKGYLYSLPRTEMKFRSES